MSLRDRMQNFNDPELVQNANTWAFYTARLVGGICILISGLSFAIITILWTNPLRIGMGIISALLIIKGIKLIKNYYQYKEVIPKWKKNKEQKK